MLVTILMVVLVLMLIGGLPNWGWGWGYGPSGVLGVVLAVILILFLMGRL